jgi:hypothetical protein
MFGSHSEMPTLPPKVYGDALEGTQLRRAQTVQEVYGHSVQDGCRFRVFQKRSEHSDARKRKIGNRLQGDCGCAAGGPKRSRRSRRHGLFPWELRFGQFH